jgi:uncharacterized protein (DUF1684 family)
VEPDPAGGVAGQASLELADWRRRVTELYGEVRERAVTDPPAAWERWRAVREALYAGHPQSPVPADRRAGFRSRHWPYAPAWRLEVDIAVDTDPDAAEPTPSAAFAPSPFAAPLLQLPMSTGEALSFRRIGAVVLPLPGGSRSLALYWMAGYAGGLFLPFRDTTNGSSTYGAGRYLLDTAKGADLGGDVRAGRLILDFNFAFHPSCAFDPRWSCPLAPPDNRLDVPVEAGERLA